MSMFEHYNVLSCSVRFSGRSSVLDTKKSKAQLISEIEELRRRLADFELANSSSSNSKSIKTLEQSPVTENEKLTKQNCLENQFLQSKTSFHEFFDEISDGVAVYEAIEDGSDFIFMKFNSAAQVMEGVANESVIGQRVTEVFPGVKEFGLLDVFKRVWRTGVPEEHPTKLYTDGKVSYWRKNTVYRLLSGEIVAVYSDETEKMQSFEALQISEEQYRLLVETMLYGVQEIDTEGEILFANSACREMLGYSRDESIVGKSIYSNLGEGEEKRLSDYLDFLIREQPEPEPWEGINVRKDGSLINIETYWNYRRNSNGEIIGFISILTDITERKRAEISIRESEEKARALLNATKDYAALIKPDGSIVAMNKPFSNFLKISQIDVIGRCILDFLPYEAAEKRRKFLAEVFSSKKPVSTETEEQGRFYHRSAYPILNNNEVTLIAVYIQDITERKISEEAIQKREWYLKGLNEATQLLLVSTESIPYQQFLSHIGPIAGASRSYIFLNHKGPEGELFISQKAEWCAEGVSPEIDNPSLQNLSYDDWPTRWQDSLRTGKLIHGRVAEFPDNERFFLEPQGILAILIIPIIVEEECIGFVGYDNCASDREWDEVEKTFLTAAINDLSQTVRRIRAENQVLSSLKEKEVLLREIHHRVKNNMQVVTSLLNLQARGIPEGKALEAIRESQRRISTISQVHEALYLSEDLSCISMKKYLTGVLREINRLYLSLNRNVVSSVNIKDVYLTITDAIPLGLITSELVTNAFKHAFPFGQEGEISVTLRELDGRIIELVITDNGIGMPENTNLSMSKQLGLQIVYNLVKSQLRGSISTIRNEKTIFIIQFSHSSIQNSTSEFDSLAGGG